MPITRRSLLLRLRADADPTGWAEFVQLYQPLLCSSARRAGIPECDIPDVVQEVLMRLLRVLPRFRYSPDRGRFRGWLRAVCRTSIIDWQRRHYRNPCASVINETSLEAEADDGQWELEHRRHVLKHAIAETRLSVSAVAWQCFDQYVLNGRSAEAVATDLKMTADAVYVIASRIRAKLRQKCTQFDEDLA